MLFGVSKWALLPSLYMLWFLIMLIILLIQAKTSCHVEELWWPFISHLGTRDPEDKVFTATFSISGLLAMTTMIIAYKFFESCNPKDSSKTNKIGLFIGLAGAFFKLMVGGYSVYTAPNLHFICAGLAFFLGTVYCNIMTVVTKRYIQQNLNTKCSWVYYFRLALCIMLGIGFIIGFSLHNITSQMPEFWEAPEIDLRSLGRPECNQFADELAQDARAWAPRIHSQEYLMLTFIGSITEWAMGLGFISFLGSFAVEFARIKKLDMIVECHDLEEKFSAIDQPSWSAIHKPTELPNL